LIQRLVTLVLDLPLSGYESWSEDRSVAMLRGRKIEVAIVVLGVALAAGCSRSASLGGAASARADQQKAPFPDDTGSSLPEDHATVASQKPGKDVDANHAPPFTSPMSPSLPAGTLLTVRLQNSLSSLRVRAGEIFAAVVDEPVVIDGNILVGRGAGVSGRVESAQTSPPTRNSASLRLILDSITIKGKQWPLQTASLFARGAPGETHNLPVASGPGEAPYSVGPSTVRLKKGRRLTFRLTQAVSLGG
jgi:hypothetical protein